MFSGRCQSVCDLYIASKRQEVMLGTKLDPLLPLDFFQPEVVDDHVSTECDPTIAKPDHLALVRLCHGLPGRSQCSIARQPIREQEHSWVLLVFLAASTI